MSRMAAGEWERVVHAHSWGHINLNDKEAGEGGRPTSLSLSADLVNCVAPPLFTAEGFPSWVPGAKSKEVPWAYDDVQQPLPYTPNVVYLPQRIPANVRSFASLHQRYLRNRVALKLGTAASTPNLQIAMVLVATHRTSPHQQQHQRQACLAGYFLPFKPDYDVCASDATYNIWLERRLGERRSRHRDKDILLWKEDQRQLDRLPSSGMPAAEQLVAFRTYHHDSSSSQYGTLSSGGCGGGAARMHCCLVQSVLPDFTFTYSLRPWRRKLDDTAATLEPDMADQQDGFLQECDCTAEAKCGKLRAREELKRLRVEGVQYPLEVRRASGLHEDAAARHGQLGVFTCEDIPEGTYVFEYVGEWLPANESEIREVKYESAGLHYLYDLSQRYALPPAAAAGKKTHHGSASADEDVPRVVDATHLGNVARFVNHRCEGANLVSVNVCMGGLDSSHMSILMRTARLLEAGEELTLDYQAGLSQQQKAKIRAKPDGLVPCRCGAACCLGHVFPKIMKQGNAVLEKTRRNGAGTRTYSCWPPLPPPPGTTTSAAAATTAAGAFSPPAASSTSTSSDDNSAAGASSGDDSVAAGGAAATTATTAVAAAAVACLLVEGPSSGISGPAGGVSDLRRSGSTPAAAGAAAAPAGAEAAMSLLSAQERGCTVAAAAATATGGGCSGADAATACPGVSTAATTESAAARHRQATVRSPPRSPGYTGLKRIRLAVPSPSPPSRVMPKPPSADGAGVGHSIAAAAAVAAASVITAAAGGATASTGTVPGVSAHTELVADDGMVSNSSGGGGGGGGATAAAAPPSGAAAAEAAAAAACSTGRG